MDNRKFSILNSQFIKLRSYPQKLAVYFLIILGLNLILSPLVQASTAGILSRGQSYALGLLGLVTVSLFVYLFVVIFQPERF
jgi:K+-transporting ATPase KdpF subunit